MTDFDIAVIGGGAAGLCAAISAKGVCGRLSVCMLERLPKTGKKILVTGNGRCNFSHTDISADRYTGSVNVKGILEQYPDLRSFFLELGVASYEDGEGRLYPLSGTAASIHEGLTLKVKQLGITVKTDFFAEDIQQNNGIFVIRSDSETIRARRVILAAGGKASPSQGSNGSGFALAEALGVSVSGLSPALCPLPADKSVLKAVEGVRVRCGAALYQRDKLLGRQNGEVQFTKNALSGICIFNLSLCCKPDEKYTVRIDLLPDFSEKQAAELILKAVNSRKGLPPDVQLSGIFHWKIAAGLVKYSFPKAPQTLGGGDAFILAQKAKAWDFAVTSPVDYTAAQVTKGGVHGSQTDGSLQSKKIKGLYFAGEILDIAGECGGYNLHFAWASGLAAGKAAGESLC